MSEKWTNYADNPPTAAGVYRWRVPSITLPGERVIFDAHMRMRGAGHTDVLSPLFDHWDGYRVSVPAETYWQTTEDTAKCKPFDYANLEIEGLSFSACPYCGKIPVLVGTHQYSDGGVLVCAKPHELNTWWLKCCSWGKTPYMTNPREIARIRERAFAAAAKSQEAGK